MKDLEISFDGSPQKFGKAAYCDLMYTQSKLYDNILFKDLINFRDVWTYKSDAMTLQALLAHISQVLQFRLLQKQCIISTQQEQITFLQQRNRQMCEKNLQRTQKLLLDHKQQAQGLIRQRAQQVKVIQAQKQLLQNRVNYLQQEVTRNANVVNGIQQQRQEMVKRQEKLQKTNSQLETKLKDVENSLEQMVKQHRAEVAQLSDEKLQIELRMKKLMIEQAHSHKQQLQELQRLSQQKLQSLQERRLNQSHASKETLNSTITSYQTLIKETKLKTVQLQENVNNLSREVDQGRQRNQSLEADVKKQDQILDQYQGYLKNADQNILQLKEVIAVTQHELQNVKYSQEKNLVEKDSLLNRIKFAQQEAKMWRESYYLNKSRTQASTN